MVETSDTTEFCCESKLTLHIVVHLKLKNIIEHVFQYCAIATHITHGPRVMVFKISGQNCFDQGDLPFRPVFLAKFFTGVFQTTGNKENTIF